MKNIILVLSFLFSLISSGQIGKKEAVKEYITVGIANKMEKLPKLEYTVIDGKKFYVLTYYNLEYANIRETDFISFYANDEELEYLFNFLMDGFKSDIENKLIIDGARIYVSKIKSSIKVRVFDPSKIDGWFYLNRKKTERLFGKRK